jgi:teichuronic acid biosynthesis glycosyltransferase TuaC
VRALVVTNMYPTPERPASGPFVRDQVEALRRRGDVEVELFAFPAGTRNYPRAARELRRRYRGEAFDVVHVHFGLVAWPALLAGLHPLVVTLHGNDLLHPRSRPATLGALPFMDLPAAVSRAFSENVPGAGRTRRVAILPCGVDHTRYPPSPRAEARERLGLQSDGRYLLFPASPDRAMKRFDRAEEVARLAEAELLHGGTIEPEDLPLWMNAANAVLVPSANEGFGLVAVEALACDVPVLATPVGIAPTLLRGIDGCLVAPFAAEAWATVARAHLEVADPRVRGRERAEWFSAELLAARVLVAYRELLAETAQTSTNDPGPDLT